MYTITVPVKGSFQFAVEANTKFDAIEALSKYFANDTYGNTEKVTGIGDDTKGDLDVSTWTIS